MSRIGATIAGFQQFLLTQLARTQQAAALSALRQSTGKAINFPSDNPSAFLQVQQLSHQLSLVTRVKANVDAAATIGAEAQIAVDEIRTHLETIREQLTLDEGGELTAAERAASQATIDSAIESIRDLSRTSIQGTRYLDGSVDYNFSGKNPSQIRRIDVFASSDETTIAGSVSTAATRATVTYAGGGGAVINSGDATLTLTGQRGATTVTITNNEALADVRDRINADSHLTGITAAVAGNDLVFTSVDYGTAATIDVDVVTGTFTTTGTTSGTDIVANINGQSISSGDADGNRVWYRDQGVNVQIDFEAGFTGTFSTVTVTDDQVARFALSMTSSDQTSFALPGLFPELMGGVSGTLAELASGGTAAGLGDNASQALRIVGEALDQLSITEGRIQAFADVTVASAGRLLDGFATELDEAIESIQEVDDDAETARLQRYEALALNTTSAMSILQQYQANMVKLLQSLAGL
jgi:flagellin-like hook-associated protein FlgL